MCVAEYDLGDATVVIERLLEKYSKDEAENGEATRQLMCSELRAELAHSYAKWNRIDDDEYEQLLELMVRCLVLALRLRRLKVKT